MNSVSFNAAADIETHTVVFNRSNITIGKSGDSATFEANRKYGGTVSATMYCEKTPYSYFINEGIGNDLFYCGTYDCEDPEKYPEFFVDFTAEFLNVGEITKENITINGSNEYHIQEQVVILPSIDPFTGYSKQEVSFTYYGSGSVSFAIFIESIEITYPCR